MQVILPTVAVLSLRLRVGSTRIFENPPVQHFPDAQNHPNTLRAQQEVRAAKQLLTWTTSSLAATHVPNLDQELEAVRLKHTAAVTAIRREQQQMKDRAVKRLRGGIRGLIRRVLKRKATAAAVAATARRYDDETQRRESRAAENLQAQLAEAKLRVEAAKAQAAEQAASLPQRVAQCNADVEVAVAKVAEIQAQIRRSDIARFEVALNCLQKRRQYAVDEALVTTIKFLHPHPKTARDCAMEYQQGTVVLVPQFGVHNPGQTTMRYEVGCVARESQAGIVGLNGCIKGIHVHVTEKEAMRHAQTMCVLPEQCRDQSVFRFDPTTVYDVLSSYKPEWKRWNCRPNPWHNSAATKCLACTKPMNDSVARYAVMDCGHGYMCGQCAGVAKEDMKCPECSIRAIRISQVW
jgi:hypothetical protein